MPHHGTTPRSKGDGGRGRRRLPSPTASTVPAGSAEAGRTGIAADDRLAGYRVLRQVARGDRAEVYLATDASGAAGGLVALRIYGAHVDGDSITVEMEAMTAGVTGLPALLDVASLADGRVCLVVERLSGPTLAAVLGARALSPGEAVTVLAPILVAVAGLAAHGFAHTRLTSADVRFDATGRARLIGLGALERIDPGAPHTEGGALWRAHVALGHLVAEVAAGTTDPRAFDAVSTAFERRLRARPFDASLAECERAVFAVGAAEPVAGTWSTGSVTGPPDPRGRVGAVGEDEAAIVAAAAAAASTQARSRIVVAPAEPTTPATPERGPMFRGGALRGMLGDLIPGLGAAVDTARLDRAPTKERTSPDPVGPPAPGVPRIAAGRARLRRAIRKRRAVLAVGGLIGGAALVLLLTVVPESGPVSVAASDPAEDEAATSSTAPDGGGNGGSDDTGGTTVAAVSGVAGGPIAARDLDAAAAAALLLAARAGCFDRIDAGCLDGVDQSASPIEGADLAALASVREGATPAPEAFDLTAITVGSAPMGDASLVSVPYRAGEREPASVLLMRTEAGWLLRELFD